MKLKFGSPVPERWEWSEAPDGWTAGAVAANGDGIDLEVRRPDEIDSPAWFRCVVRWNGKVVHLSEHHSARGAHETAAAAAERAWQLRNAADWKDPGAAD